MAAPHTKEVRLARNHDSEPIPLDTVRAARLVHKWSPDTAVARFQETRRGSIWHTTSGNRTLQADTDALRLNANPMPEQGAGQGFQVVAFMQKHIISSVWRKVAISLKMLTLPLKA